LESAICCRQDRRPPLRLVKIFLKSGSRSFGIHLESSYYPNFVAFRLNINSLLRSILGVYLRRSISGFTFCGTRCRLCLFRQSFFHIRGVQGFWRKWEYIAFLLSRSPDFGLFTHYLRVIVAELGVATLSTPGLKAVLQLLLVVCSVLYLRTKVCASTDILAFLRNSIWPLSAVLEQYVCVGMNACRAVTVKSLIGSRNARSSC